MNLKRPLRLQRIKEESIFIFFQRKKEEEYFHNIKRPPSLQRIIRRKPVMIHFRATIMAGSLLSSWLDIRLQPSTAAETFCLVRKMTLLLLCLSTTALIPHSLLNAETQLACCEGAQLGDDTGYGCWLRCCSSGHNETIITTTTNFSGCDSIEIDLVLANFGCPRDSCPSRPLSKGTNV